MMTDSQSPVFKARGIKPLNRLLLFVRAGGRCQFDGCNRDVLRHHVTLTEGIFGDMAHVVAFRPLGPRGLQGRRPTDINDLRNLMLLCPTCHRLVDRRPPKYSRRTLEEYKARHERRIRYVTALGPDRKTTVVVLRARVGDDDVQVPFDQLIEATDPRYPTSPEPLEIDLTAFSDRGTAFIRAASDEIEQRMKRFFAPGGESHRAQHVSVFALAPIPLLVLLGRQLTNKVASEVYQRHRDTEDWTWKKTGRSVRYAIKRRRVGGRRRVALMLSLSGTIPLRALPEGIRRRSTIYELTLNGTTPKPTYLRRREDLEKFRIAYQETIGTILRNHVLISHIDLFPAVPAPVAVLCGRDLLPKVHPRLRVYDYDKTKGGFHFALEV